MSEAQAPKACVVVVVVNLVLHVRQKGNVRALHFMMSLGLPFTHNTFLPDYYHALPALLSKSSPNQYLLSRYIYSMLQGLVTYSKQSYIYSELSITHRVHLEVQFGTQKNNQRDGQVPSPSHGASEYD